MTDYEAFSVLLLVESLILKERSARKWRRSYNLSTFIAVLNSADPLERASKIE